MFERRVARICKQHFLEFKIDGGIQHMNHLTPEQHKKLRNIIRWQRIGCIGVKISETLGVSLKEALDFFYRSETCRRFHDEETGLYLQGDLYVLNDFLSKIAA